MSAALAVYFVVATPVLEYWLDTHTIGTRPVNKPTPPRICVFALWCTSQLKPILGDNKILDLGGLLLLTPFSVAISDMLKATLLTGLLKKTGRSARKP